MALVSEKGLGWELGLRKKLKNMKMKEGEEVKSCVHDFDFTISQLEGNGGKINEFEKMCWLLMALPESYETFIKVFMNLSEEFLNYESLKRRIINEEERRGSIYKNTDKVTENETVVQMSKIKCYSCGQFGHKKRYCNFNKNDTLKCAIDFRQNMFHLSSNRFNNVGKDQQVITNKVKGKQIEFIVDSIAPHHMVNSKLYFFEYVKLNDPMKLQIAKDDESKMAVGKGTIEVLSTVNDHKTSVSIKNVLHIPNLKYNLLSVRKMASFGLKIVFQYNRVNIYNESNECVAVGKGPDVFKVMFQTKY